MHHSSVQQAYGMPSQERSISSSTDRTVITRFAAKNTSETDRQQQLVGECDRLSAKIPYKKASERPAVTVARRNARERKRVHTVNQMFGILKCKLPSLQHKSKRVSKLKILKAAMEYIYDMQDILDEVDCATVPTFVADNADYGAIPRIAVIKDSRRIMDASHMNRMEIHQFSNFDKMDAANARKMSKSSSNFRRIEESAMFTAGLARNSNFGAITENQLIYPNAEFREMLQNCNRTQAALPYEGYPNVVSGMYRDSNQIFSSNKGPPPLHVTINAEMDGPPSGNLHEMSVYSNEDIRYHGPRFCTLEGTSNYYGPPMYR